MITYTHINIPSLGYCRTKNQSFKMKFALLFFFLGTSLAVSPFEAIVEEWEVISCKQYIKMTSYHIKI